MSDFGTRIRPEQISPEHRQQIIGDCRLSEALLQSATFVGAVAISLLLSLVYRWHGELSGSEWRPITLVIMLAALTMIGIRLWFRWEYHFLKDAPVVSAEVDEIDVTADDKHVLKLKFEPEHEPDKPGHEEIVTAELHSSAPAFNEQLHPGDLVSVIYEPRNPGHVHVVELEEQEQPVGSK
jgi:hypothetical protein